MIGSACAWFLFSGAEKFWLTLATRVPAFEALKVGAEWAGRYADSALDQNAVSGPHPDLRNFLLVNSFSGRGL